MKVLIVRDRESSGGGIYGYYQAISPHLTVDHAFVGVGRPHSFFNTRESALGKLTIPRLLGDWLMLIWKIVWFRPDLVHVNPGLDATSLRALRRDAVNVLLARLLGCQIVVFWRGWNSSWVGNPQFPRGNDGWLARIYRSAAVQIVLSKRFKEDLRRWGFTMPIYVETTAASKECLSAGRATGGSEEFNLVFLSRIEVNKGVFELLDAYRILKREEPKYRLTVAGDGAALAELKRRAEELDLRDVSFPGYVSGQAKIDCLRNASVFCFPSSHGEGMPNAVLEAMMMGLPVVSSDVGGLRDILEEGTTGMILPFREGGVEKNMFDPVEIAAAVRQLARDPEGRARIAKYNADYARRRFSAPAVAKRLEAIYASVATDGSEESGELGSGNCEDRDVLQSSLSK